MQNNKTKGFAGGALALALIGGGAGIAAAGSGGDDPNRTPAAVADNAVEDAREDANDSEAPITGNDLDKASAAALRHTGGGTVTDTEVGDEEGYYEVEVTLDNGRQVDVHLDRNFKVLGDEVEEAGEDD